MAYITLEKVYGSVSREIIWRSLEVKGVRRCLEILKSPNYSVQEGVYEGSILSSLLVVVTLNVITQNI